MDNIIKDFKVTNLEKSSYIKSLRLSYNINGKDKTWEAVKCFDSVAVLLYHEEKNALIIVKQFRAPVFFNHNQHTHTYELCAGIIDKDVSLEQIVKEEIDEECGYAVEVKDIKKITSFYTNVGISGGHQELFYAKVNDSMKIHDGGGINDEDIELMFLNPKDIEEFIFDESKAKTSGLMFSLYWFEKNKEKLFENN